MVVQLDVDVLGRPFGLAPEDELAVHQRAGGNEGAVDVERVHRRNHQVAVRQPAAERILPDHDGDQLPGSGDGVRRVAAAPDPLDRLRRAGRGLHQVADLKVFHRRLAGRRCDARAGGIAGGDQETFGEGRRSGVADAGVHQREVDLEGVALGRVDELNLVQPIGYVAAMSAPLMTIVSVVFPAAIVWPL